MAKLYAKGRPVTMSSLESDGYHCCRWCHWVKVINGDFVCTNPCYAGSPSIDLVQVSEDGRLSETLEEALHNVPKGVKNFLEELTSKLYDWKLSDKRIGEFEDLFSECLDQFLDQELKGEIDEKVSVLYNNFVSDNKSEGIVISDPLTHYCREFS